MELRLSSLSKLVDIVGRHARNGGIHIPGVRLIRLATATIPMPVVCDSLGCHALIAILADNSPTPWLLEAEGTSNQRKSS